jgi:hypothetical protein
MSRQPQQYQFLTSCQSSFIEETWNVRFSALDLLFSDPLPNRLLRFVVKSIDILPKASFPSY